MSEYHKLRRLMCDDWSGTITGLFALLWCLAVWGMALWVWGP